ncbi:hypothetical protein ACWCY1_22345 [Streptomyces goshikiensis]
MTTLALSLRAVLASAVLLSGTVLATATPASAATCPASDSPKIRGAVATWTLKCVREDGEMYLAIDGWVEDTLPDNRCARVKILPSGERLGTYESACGSGVRQQIHHRFYGFNSASVRLSVS